MNLGTSCVWVAVPSVRAASVLTGLAYFPHSASLLLLQLRGVEGGSAWSSELESCKTRKQTLSTHPDIMISCGKKVTVSAFPAHTPWLLIYGKRAVPGSYTLWLSGIVRIWDHVSGVLSGQAKGRGVRHSFWSWPLNILFVLRSENFGGKKKDKAIWPQLQINSTLPILPKLKKLAT